MRKAQHTDGVISASRGAPIPQTGMAGFDRNQWQLSIGISGNLRLESVAGFDRNQWQLSTGIRIASICKDIGVDISSSLGNILPAHFQILIDNMIWEDVTEEHKEAIDSISRSVGIKEDFYQRREWNLAMQRMVARHVNEYHLIDSALKSLYELDKKLGIENGQFKPTPFQRIPMDFWNIKQPDDNITE